MAHISKNNLITLIMLVGSLSAFFVYSWLMYKSGCTGDLKTGVYGNPQEALKIQSQAVPFFWGALSTGVLAFIFSSKSMLFLRTITRLWVLLLIPAIVIAGFYFEVKGVTTCF